MLVQLKEALGYAAYITCTTFLPNAVNVVTLFYGAPSPAKAFAVSVLATTRTSQMCDLLSTWGQGLLCMQAGTWCWMSGCQRGPWCPSCCM